MNQSFMSSSTQQTCSRLKYQKITLIIKTLYFDNDSLDFNKFGTLSIPNDFIYLNLTGKLFNCWFSHFILTL